MKARGEAEAHARNLAAWEAERAELAKELLMADDQSVFTQEIPALSLNLKRHERVFLLAQNVALVEPRKLPGHWVGGSSGISFAVMRGVRVHAGQSRGTYVAGPTAPAAVAVGTATVTNQRIVFQSSAQAREFSFSKMLGYQHDAELPLTYFQVSNRQKVSGIGYDTHLARPFRFRVALALAAFNGDTLGIAHQVREEYARHDAARPVPPVSLPVGS